MTHLTELTQVVSDQLVTPVMFGVFLKDYDKVVICFIKCHDMKPEFNS
jgi:hypothetical protein